MVVLCRFHNLKCHLEWLSENGLPSNSGEQGRRKNLGDKAFRYLLAASDRADLDARLKVHAEKTVPLMYPDNLALQGKYIQYLLKTRFAGAGHTAYVVGDVKAKQHTQYGLHDHPDASQFNLNVESIIRVLLVDEVDRRAFNGFLSAFEFLSEFSPSIADAAGAKEAVVGGSVPDTGEGARSCDGSNAGASPKRAKGAAAADGSNAGGSARPGDCLRRRRCTYSPPHPSHRPPLARSAEFRCRSQLLQEPRRRWLAVRCTSLRAKETAASHAKTAN